MTDPRTDAGTSGSDRLRAAVAGQEFGSTDPAQATSSDLPDWDWPPVSYAENDHILVWWIPEYDDMLRQFVAEYQWAWQSQVLTELPSIVPEAVLHAWRAVDPQCREYAWYNVLWVFVAARAKQLGIHPREPQLVLCSCCSREFLESHLPWRYIVCLGVNSLDVCDTCLSQALYPGGSSTSTPEAVTAVLQTLSRALQRTPKATDLYGRVDLQGLPRDARADVVRALRVKPTVSRVKELYGSLDGAVAHAAAAPATPLPPYERPAPLVDAEFTSTDPARYRALTGLLPQVRIDAAREPWTYAEQLQSLVGTGYLALAEAALVQLTQPPEPGHLISLLAQVYGQTARFDDARTVLAAVYGEDSSSADQVIPPRDIRTVTSGPVFYEPLGSLPRGNVRFVLVGGPMEYVDRRGEHQCVTGEASDGSAAAHFAESVARMSAMVDSRPWVQSATQTGQAIMTSLIRAGADPLPYGHLLSYVTSTFRDVVKAVAGALPKKVAEDAWRIGPMGKSRWSYQRDAAHYVYNAHAGFTYITVESAPAVCIWAWPDRSDLVLQAFLDTVAVGTADPVTVILPDVPAFREFARRYVHGEHMAKVDRAPMEECFYRFPPEAPTMRGDVLSAEFAPRLVVNADGTERDGAVFASTLAYLDAHHTLRLSAWDVLGDALLREVAAATPAAALPFSVSAFDRSDKVQWHARNAAYEDAGALLRPYRPSLLGAVISA